MIKRERTFLSTTQRITLGGMLIALSLLSLYFASIAPTGRLTFYVLSSVFVAAFLIEGEVSPAWLVYIAVSLLGLGIINDKLRLFPYIIFFGNYGIIKYFIEKSRNAVTRVMLKLIYFNVMIVVMYAVSKQVLLADIQIKIPLWTLMVAAQFAFLLYDYIFTGLISFYDMRIREHIIHRR